MNSIIFHGYSNEIYLQNLLRNLLVNLRNLFLVEPVLEKGFLDLFSTEPTSYYRKMLKFRGMGSEWLKNCKHLSFFTFY